MSKGVGVRWESLVMGHSKQEEGNEKKKKKCQSPEGSHLHGMA